MKPENRAYDGLYGQYEYGLSFYKIFCPTGGCLKGIQSAIKTIVSTQYFNGTNGLEIVKEWLCPAERFGSKRQSNCIQYLTELEKQNLSERPELWTYSPFRDKQLDCSLQSCFALPKCFRPDLPDIVHQCAGSVKITKKTTTFVREFLIYLEALKSI